MNSIIVPNSYQKYDIEKFKSLIESCDAYFRINKSDIWEIIDIIKKKHTKFDFDTISNALLFLIYNMVKTDYIIEPLHHSFGGRPSSSFCFMNKLTSQSKGIYHAHISDIDSGVLIWYVTLGKNGYMVNFEYHAPHPYNNEYLTIIDRIYNTKDSYNIEIFGLLSDTPSLLVETVIKFGEFLRYNS